MRKGLISAIPSGGFKLDSTMERKVETQAKIRKPLKNLLGGWVSFYGIL
jgi:hypothetical protein